MQSVESLDQQPPYTGTLQDWASALSLTERRDVVRAGGRAPLATPMDPEAVLRHHDVWADAPIHDTVEQLAVRLAAEGMGVDEYCVLSAGVEMPADAAERWFWVALLEELCRDWGDLQQADEPARQAPNPASEALLTLVRPFLVWALRGIRRDLHELRAGDATGVLAGEGLAVQLLRGLPERLRQFATPVTVLELHVARVEAGLAESEILQAAGLFRERLLDGAGGSLLREYPVMARTLAELTLQHRRNALELARAVRDDAAALAERFAPDGDLGELTEVEEPVGDAHQDGRAVRKVRFGGGRQLLYKPRSLAIDVFLADFLAWLSSKRVTATQRPIAVLARDGYGWTEVIEAAPCASPAAVERFYRRQGGLLAVAYVLAAKDLHFENVIAAGEFPVAVDLEGYFQPPLDRVDDVPQPTGALLELLETGLLPRGMSQGEGEQAWFDPSGIAGSGGVLPTALLRLAPAEEGLRYRKEQVTVPTHPNLPVLDGERVPPRAYAQAIEAGFREVCEVVHAHADDLLAPGGLVHRAHGLGVRLFLRASQLYGRLLAGMAHPDLAHDALDRERLIDVLWPHQARSRLFEATFTHERQSLLRGDIPMFGTDTDGVEVRSSDGPGTGIEAERTGFSVVEERVRALDPERVEDLAWVLRACIAATVPQTEDQGWPLLLARRRPGADVPAGALRQRAADIARLLARRVEEGPTGVTWVGLNPVREEGWSFGRASVGLYEGAAGITLFLGYAGACTGEEALSARARDGLDMLRRTWEERFDLPDGAPATLLGGAFGDFGGTVLALTHLGVLWGRDDLLREALALCVAAEPHLPEVTEHDVIGGLAGTVMVLLTLHDVAGDAALLRMATRCAGLLEERADDVGGGLGWTMVDEHLAGFSHGAAGIAAALARLSRTTGEARWWDLALRARRFEDSLYSGEHRNWQDMRGIQARAGGGNRYPSMWCHGAPGIAVSRAIMLSARDDERAAEDLRAAVATTLETNIASNHCVCHGSIGNLLCLRRCEGLEHGVPEGTVAGLVPSVLHTLERHGPVTGAPFGVFTPGFMVGSAGIGYGLLALADPALPSLLGVDDLPR